MNDEKFDPSNYEKSKSIHKGEIWKFREAINKESGKQ